VTPIMAAKINSDNPTFVSNSFRNDLFDSIQSIQTILHYIPVKCLNLKTNKDLM
jgi:hypothetical protein